MEVYHSRYGRQDEIVIFGGCKNDNWDNGDIGIFVNATVAWYSSENCWGSQTKLVRRTYFIMFVRFPTIHIEDTTGKYKNSKISTFIDWFTNDNI